MKPGRIWLDRRTRAKPRWTIIYQDWDGRWRRESTTAANRKEARVRLAQKESDVQRLVERGGPAMDMTFRSFVETEFLPHSKAVNTPRTYTTKCSRATGLMPTFGDRKLREISRADIKRFVAFRRTEISAHTGRPYTAASINRDLMFLSATFREAWDREYVDANPCRRVELLPERNQRDRWLTDDEERKLMANAAPHLRPIIQVAIHTGMRRGELLRMTWADVDFDQRLIRIPYAKNHKTRYVPVNDTLYALLDDMAPQDPAWGAGRPVFAHQRARGVPKTVRTAFDAACRRAGLVDVTFHTLRHTFASRLVQAGRPLLEVGELLGHGSPKVTMRYAHLAPGNLRNAVQSLVKPGQSVTPALQSRDRSRGAM